MINATLAPPDTQDVADPERDARSASPLSRRAMLATTTAALATAACAPAGGGKPVPSTTAPPAPTTPPTVPPTTAAPTTTIPAGPVTPTPPGGEGVTTRIAIDKLTFGPAPGLAAAIEARGVWSWIDDQLNPVARNVPDAEWRLAGYATLTNTHRQNFDVQDSDDGWYRLIEELDHATVQRAVYSQRQLYELMCDFWSNHFNTWRQKTWMLFLKNRSNETVIRANALGKFSTMLLASARDSAMLDYLDNLPSDASSPGGVNENYARELMELHSLGIVNGVQTHTEADVRGVAKVISGWSINWDDNATRYDFRFLPWQHSLDAVTVLGGAFSRPARTYGQGYDDGVRLIDVLAHHPATARHIAWKLCKRFVSDTPSEALIASTAAVFTANDTAIAPTLRHIFSSPEFAAGHKRKVRRPFEVLVGALRATGAAIPLGWNTQTTDKVRDMLDNLGQPLYERHSPDGYPDVNAFWLSSEGFLQRWAMLGRLARNKLTDPTQPNPIVVNLPSLLPSPQPPTVAALIRWLAENLGNYTMSDADVADLCSACAFTATAAGTTVSGDANKLALAVGLVLSHPSFQQR